METGTRVVRKGPADFPDGRRGVVVGVSRSLTSPSGAYLLVRFDGEELACLVHPADLRTKGAK